MNPNAGYPSHLPSLGGSSSPAARPDATNML